MLTKLELESYTTFNDPYQVEKGYLQDILLREIYAKSYTTSSLVFKGGTALSKFYQSGRFSEDLDFTVISGVKEAGAISESLEKISESLLYKATLIKKPARNRFGTIAAEMAIEGPRYNGKPSTVQHIGFEINTSSTLKYKPIPMIRRPAYKDLPEYTAWMMDGREIFAEKIRAVMGKGRRHKERDLYDIYFLLGKNVEPDRKTVLEKLGESGVRFSKTALLQNIHGIKETWSQLEVFTSAKLVGYNDAERFVIGRLKGLKVL